MLSASLPLPALRLIAGSESAKHHRLSGINTAVAVSISGGEYSVNGGEYTKAKGVAKAGDKCNQLAARYRCSKSSKKTVTTSLTVGTVKAAFKSTTQ